MSSTNLISKFVSGCTTLISLTIMENNTGSKTVTCGTPLSIPTNFVVKPSTTTLCL